MLLAVVEIVECAKDNLEIAGKLFFGEQEGGTGSAGAFVAGNLEQLSVLAAKTGHKCVAQIANELAGKGTRAVAGVEQDVELVHQLGGAAGCDGLEQAFKDGIGDRSHQIADLAGGEDSSARLDGG